MKQKIQLMDFDTFAITEAKASKFNDVISTVRSVLGDTFGEVYIVPDFETFQRSGEPEQTSMLVATSNGESFAVNMAGTKFHSIDMFNKNVKLPSLTVYSGGRALEKILGSIVKSLSDTSEKKLPDGMIELFVVDDDEDKNPKSQQVKLTVVESKPRNEINAEVAAIPVIPSEVENPKANNDKLKPQNKADYEFQDPETIFKDLAIYTNMVIEGTQPAMLITGMAGLGKCHRRGDKLLMFDLSVKSVEDIVTGDFLMGDDSNFREVISTTNGFDDIYEIRPIKGNSFFVNKDHILCVIHSVTGKITEISVQNFLNLPKCVQRDSKLYRVGLDFDAQEINIDPYWLGLWLGDGCSHAAGITISKNDPEILESHFDYCDSLGMSINNYIDKRGTDNCRIYMPSFINGTGKVMPDEHILVKLRSNGLSGPSKQSNRKFIPTNYLQNDRNIRLQLLAGIIDSDGCKVGNGCYEIAQKSKQLIDDIALLSRSLGYYVHQTEKVCTIKSIGFSGLYHRLVISGANDVPCRVERKKSTIRLQKKNVLRTGFTVIPVGQDEYFGFTLTGNGRYLMHDFIVTHNTHTVISEIKKAGLIKDQDYYHVKGKSTAAGLYQTLWEQNDKLTVFDDMDSIFKDENAVNILKGALDSSDVREISWLTARPLKIDGKDMPKTFDFTGRVIFITNIAQKNIDDAIKSRSFVVEIALTPEDMIVYIESMFNNIMKYDRVSTKRYALDKLKEAAANDPDVQINIRTFMKATKIVKHVNDKKTIDRMIIQQCSYN